jgi:hypothetical protein
MASYAQKSIATLFAGTVLAVGVASPASAQTKQDGLVNVNVGDVTILEDVNIAAAVDAVAVLCPAVSVSDIAILARQTDTTSRTTTVCRTEDNDKVRFTQN